MLTTTDEGPGPATDSSGNGLFSDRSPRYRVVPGHPVWAHGWELASRTPRAPLVAMAAGLIVTAVASFLLVVHLSSGSGGAGAATRRPAPASSGVAIGGPSDVAAQTAFYAPGQSSGWHSHTGLHAVVVLAGTLTIVDGECRRHTYGPGDSYVGGRDVHLALNDTASPLEMAVTYMFPAGVSHTGFHVPAAEPARCGTR